MDQTNTQNGLNKKPKTNFKLQIRKKANLSKSRQETLNASNSDHKSTLTDFILHNSPTPRF